jgi:hypothetical protein
MEALSDHPQAASAMTRPLSLTRHDRVDYFTQVREAVQGGLAEVYPWSQPEYLAMLKKVWSSKVDYLYQAEKHGDEAIRREGRRTSRITQVGSLLSQSLLFSGT